MSRLCKSTGWAKVAVGLLLLGAASAACDEDGKTAPDKCGTPPLMIYDVQGGAQDADGNPCVTPVGHAISEILPATPSGGTAASGGSAGKGGSAGNGGKGGSVGLAGQGGDAGSGGA
jgi:hypothetical protein